MSRFVDRTRQRNGRLTMALATLAALVTLGHLIGPFSHAPFAEHGHAALAESLPSQCHAESDGGGGDDHGEVNCGSVLIGASIDAVFVPDRIGVSLDPMRSAAGSASTDFGPNGRAPPERAQLQVIRV